MISREIQLPKDEHFFLFGARNTGKSTWIKHCFPPETSLVLDLLDPKTEEHLTRHPEELVAMLAALPDQITHVVIDEIQKIPKLLNLVHQLIETQDRYFVMTGSSAKKLKKGSANLLAGRAFVYHLYPFTYTELGDSFCLKTALHYGLLPAVWQKETDRKKVNFLQSYAHTYLKEEIWAEQLVRRLDPFRRFLEVAAQSAGKSINFSKIARDVGVDTKTAQQYFMLLEDTLVGFMLPAYHHSFRKRLLQQPKFYFFDVGIARTLQNMITVPLKEQTFAYGDCFEQFVILECQKRIMYRQLDFRLHYLRTQTGVEVDLVVERPGLPLLLIEIKSTTTVLKENANALQQIAASFPSCDAILLSQDTTRKSYGDVQALFWQDVLETYF